MEIKTIPDKLTKKMLFEILKPLPEKRIREVVNFYILQLGKNVRIRILPDLVKLNVFLRFGIPYGYKLSDQLQKKLDKLNEIRKEKC